MSHIFLELLFILAAYGAAWVLARTIRDNLTAIATALDGPLPNVSGAEPQHPVRASLRRVHAAA